MPITIKEIELLTLRECAEELGLSKRRVQQFVDEDRLKAQKIGNTWHVTREDLEAFKKIPRRVGNLTGLPRTPVGRKTG